MRDEKHDVVVVGAGPGGSIAARTAAGKGLDVVLIERNLEIGVPVKCAEGVSREIDKFVEIDYNWISAVLKGTITHGPDGSEVVLSVDGMDEAMYVLERRLFDKFLAQDAIRAGADVRVKTAAYGVIKEQEQVKGIYAHAAGEDIRIFADVVVGADGVESRVGRWGGIDTRLRLADVSTCAQYLMCDVEPSTGYGELFFGEEIAPRGYAWIFPKGEDTVNVGVGIGGDVSDENHRALAYLNAFARDKFPDGEIITEIYGAVPLSGPVYETVSAGLLLVGDAARHVNPITGGGILEAMHGGKIAGEVIAKAVQEKNFSKRRLMEYEKRWKKEFGRILYAGMKAKQLLLNLDSKAFNEFFHPLAGDIKIKEFTERALLKEMIKKNPKILFSLVRMMF